MINEKLKEYIEGNILPQYEGNDAGHSKEHIDYVTKRSLEFAEKVDDVNLDMVYTTAAFHDIGHNIDSDNHEKESAKILEQDEFVSQYFNEEEKLLIKEAIEDHRASLEGEPRSIYGKIVSSADRITSLDEVIKRTLSYRIKTKYKSNIDQIMDESLEHIKNKYGNQDAYAASKMYFEDEAYINMLNEAAILTSDTNKFREKYINVNNIGDSEEYIQYVFKELSKNENLSLDERFYFTYNKLITEKSFEEIKAFLIEKNNINEMEYYLIDVDPELKEYVEQNAFPEYEKNDEGHGMVHISEVIKRSFALNESQKLNLNPNMIYAIAAYHDIGKHVNSAIHEKISAILFNQDEFMKKYFTKEERALIKAAIEDHRSSREGEPRSEYGKLISSADRNTSVEIVFLRSFLVGKEKMPEYTVEDYLEFTYERLKKRYSQEKPENMFYEDEIYKVFLEDMRKLLQDETKFKDLYCKTNGIDSRQQRLRQVDFVKENTEKDDKERDKHN